MVKGFNLLLVVIEGGVGNFLRRQLFEIIPLKVGGITQGGD